MPTRILTPEQVVAEMSALTESLRTGVHVSSSLGENIIAYNNYIPLFDRGHKRTVGWNAGNTTKLRPEDSDINLEDVDAGGNIKCPELFQPVRKKYVVQYFKTVFTPLFHNMEADLHTYRAQYAQYLTQMTEYRNTTGNVIRIRPRAPRRPQCGVTVGTAFGSSIRTLDFFLYKQLRSRLSSIIYSIRGNPTELNLRTKLNECRAAANAEMTAYWTSLDDDEYIGVQLVNDFTMTDPGVGGVPAPQAVVPPAAGGGGGGGGGAGAAAAAAAAAAGGGGGGGGAAGAAAAAPPSAYEKDCKKRQSGHRILIIKDDRSVRRDPCIYASPEYTTAYRDLQQHYENVYQEILQRFTTLETQDRVKYDEERKQYDSDRSNGFYAELPRRVSRKKEWNEAIHALTEEMRRIIITPTPPRGGRGPPRGRGRGRGPPPRGRGRGRGGRGRGPPPRGGRGRGPPPRGSPIPAALPGVTGTPINPRGRGPPFRPPLLMLNNTPIITKEMKFQQNAKFDFDEFVKAPLYKEMQERVEYFWKLTKRVFTDSYKNDQMPLDDLEIENRYLLAREIERNNTTPIDLPFIGAMFQNIFDEYYNIEAKVSALANGDRQDVVYVKDYFTRIAEINEDLIALDLRLKTYTTRLQDPEIETKMNIGTPTSLNQAFTPSKKEMADFRRETREYFEKFELFAQEFNTYKETHDDDTVREYSELDSYLKKIDGLMSDITTESMKKVLALSQLLMRNGIEDATAELISLNNTLNVLPDENLILIIEDLVDEIKTKISSPSNVLSNSNEDIIERIQTRNEDIYNKRFDLNDKIEAIEELKEMSRMVYDIKNGIKNVDENFLVATDAFGEDSIFNSPDNMSPEQKKAFFEDIPNKMSPEKKEAFFEDIIIKANIERDFEGVEEDWEGADQWESDFEENELKIINEAFSERRIPPKRKPPKRKKFSPELRSKFTSPNTSGSASSASSASSDSKYYTPNGFAGGGASKTSGAKRSLFPTNDTWRNYLLEVADANNEGKFKKLLNNSLTQQLLKIDVIRKPIISLFDVLSIEDKEKSKAVQDIIIKANDTSLAKEIGKDLYIFLRTRLTIRCLFLRYVDSLKENDLTRIFRNILESQGVENLSSVDFPSLTVASLKSITVVLGNVLSRKGIDMKDLKLTKYQDPDLAIIEMDRAYSQRLMTI